MDGKKSDFFSRPLRSVSDSLRPVVAMVVYRVLRRFRGARGISYSTVWAQSGYAAVSVAAQNGNDGVLRLLLEARAGVDSSCEVGPRPTPCGQLVP